MTDDQNKTAQPDWTQLAKDALDIWQNHLTSLATDPKAKEEMARFVTPMTEAMAGWSSVVQQGMHQMMKMAAAAAEQTQNYAAESEATNEEPAAESPEPPEAPEPPAPAEPEQNESDQQVVIEETVQNDEPAAPAAMDEPAGDEQPVQSAPDAPAGEPRIEPAPEGGRTLAPDGSRSLAELAGRLAVLERELDQLRPRTRRKDTAAEPMADGTDEPVAGAHQETNTP